MISRRSLLGLSRRTPSINPRDTWAAGLPAPGGLPEEQPGDVRVLLVHHSASSNDYAAGDVPGIIRGFHALHTGDRGWPDVAYNFFVDRHGGTWEGRAGSLERPVIGDATGGNQGYSQLVCLVGDHREEPPTDAALAALVDVLAFLAARYGIDTRPGAETSFVSRGSNKWPAGTTVTTTTLAGHRDMSATVCPGDAAYVIVREQLPTLVAGLAQPTETAPSSTSTTSTTSTTASTTSTTSASTAPPRVPSPSPRSEDDDGVPAVLVGGAVVVVGAVAALALRVRRRRSA